MCNGKTKSFVKIFVDFDNGGKNNNGSGDDGDDEISLSSLESTHSGEQNQIDNDDAGDGDGSGNDNDRAATATTTTARTIRADELIAGTTVQQTVIEIDLDDSVEEQNQVVIPSNNNAHPGSDTTGVVEIINGNNGVLGRAASQPSQPNTDSDKNRPGRPKRGDDKTSRTSNDRSNGRKYKRLAISFKQRFEDCQKRADQLKEKRADDILTNRKLSETLTVLNAQSAQLQAQSHKLQLELAEARLDATRRLKAVESLEERIAEATMAKSQAEKQLQELQSKFDSMIREARIESVTEAQELVVRTRDLETKNQHLQQQIRQMNQLRRVQTYSDNPITPSQARMPDPLATASQQQIASFQTKRRMVKEFQQQKRAEMAHEQQKAAKTNNDSATHERLRLRASRQGARMSRALSGKTPSRTPAEKVVAATESRYANSSGGSMLVRTILSTKPSKKRALERTATTTAPLAAASAASTTGFQRTPFVSRKKQSNGDIRSSFGPQRNRR